MPAQDLQPNQFIDQYGNIKTKPVETVPIETPQQTGTISEPSERLKQFSIDAAQKDFSNYFVSPTGSVGPGGEQIMDVFRSDGTKVRGEEAEGLGLTGDVIAGLEQRPAPTGFVSEFEPVSSTIEPTAEDPSVDLPEPTASVEQEATVNSLQSEVDRLRNELDTRIANEKAEVEKKIEELRAKEQQLLDEAKPLTDAFRADLENAERERLHINENFEANQALVGELESLLTDGNALIEQMKGKTGLAGIRNPRINQAIEAVNARAGVITAVMNARNSQISVAENMIDRSVKAITADRNDQLAYYNTLLDLNSKKIVNLESQQQAFLEAQIGLLEKDLQKAEEKADYIKGLMLDPNTAELMARSGVTLNDTPEQIQKKFSDYTYIQEKKKLNAGLREQGLEWIGTPEELANIPADQIVKVEDSRGQIHQYRRVKPIVEGAGGFQQLINPLTGKVIATKSPSSKKGDESDIEEQDKAFEKDLRALADRVYEGELTREQARSILRNVYPGYDEDAIYDFVPDEII